MKSPATPAGDEETMTPQEMELNNALIAEHGITLDQMRHAIKAGASAGRQDSAPGNLFRSAWPAAKANGIDGPGILRSLFTSCYLEVLPRGGVLVNSNGVVIAEERTRHCPDCGKLPTWVDPENPNHIVCAPCDLESLLKPTAEQEAERRTGVPCLSPFDQHQTGCACRECKPDDTPDDRPRITAGPRGNDVYVDAITDGDGITRRLSCPIRLL